jgi:hypothetical protein
MVKPRYSLNYLLTLAGLLELAGCESAVRVEATVTVPPSAQAAYMGGYPAQVVVSDNNDTNEKGAPEHNWRVGTICEPSDEAAVFHYVREDSSDCAEETVLKAWLLPLPPGEAAVCGASAKKQRLDLPPLSEPPWATATAFAGVDSHCGDDKDHVDLTLTAP